MLLSQNGFDAYMACSGFKDGSSRKQSNVSAIKSFWLDIDCGPGKDYPDLASGSAALQKFCADANLPPPTIVCSGYGLHVYWPMKVEMVPEAWQPKADALKALTKSLGLRADHACTTDSARILRLPGTTNWGRKKEGPKPVYIIHQSPEYDSLEFGAVSPIVNSDWSLFADNVGSAAPSMVQGYPDGQRTQELVRRIGWLLGPKGVIPQEAYAELQKWNSFNQPPLDDEKIISAVNSISKSEFEKRQTKTKEVFGNDTLPTLPKGFRWGQNLSLECEKKKENEDDPQEWLTISEYPLYADRMVKHETTEKLSTRIRFKHPQEGWKEVLMPNYELEGQSWKQHLSAHGITIYSAGAKGFRTYIEITQNKLRASSMDATQYDQFGPRDEFKSFLYGTKLYYAGGKIEEASISDLLSQRARLMGPAKGADIVSWTDAADCLFATGCEAQGFTLLASFAAPLIHMLCGNDGGAILSLTSPDSGTGKSTALEAAASVWGHLHATKVSNVSTANSITRQCEILGYLPIICDEKTNKDKDSHYIIEQKRVYTDGIGKGRLNQNGSNQAMPKDWHTIMIEASNRPFIELAIEANDRAMMARVLELSVSLPEQLKKNRSDKKLQQQLDDNRGIAGHIYIQYLMTPGTIEWARKALKEAQQQVEAALGLGNDYRFIYWLVASCIVAGVITKKLGLLHFDLPRMTNYIIDQVKNRDMAASAGIEKPEELLAYIFTTNMSDCLVVDDAYRVGKANIVLRYPKSSPHMRMELKTKRMFIPTAALRKYCKFLSGQPSPGWITKECAKIGIISQKPRQISLGAGTDVDAGRILCLEIDMSHPVLSGVAREIKEAPTQPQVAKENVVRRQADKVE